MNDPYCTLFHSRASGRRNTMSFAESTSHHVQVSSQQILSQLDQVSPWNNTHTPTQTKSTNSSNTLVCTPKKTSEDMDSILTSDKNTGKFDSISKNIVDTISELNVIYKQIGYSTTEISIKKSEIFQVIEESILTFTGNLRREKNSIENECEWLRQQIRIILAMVDDNSGQKNLKLVNRGIVFNDDAMYEEGYKEDILNKVTVQSRRHQFYANSPFNDSMMDEVTPELQYEYMMKDIPKLSLLQLKTKLNSIFLDVLKCFIKSFARFNCLNLAYLDLTDTIGEYYSDSANVSVLKSLPCREDAEGHRSLIDEFDSTIKDLNLTGTDTSILNKSKTKNDDNTTFIISSPRKSKPAEVPTNDQSVERLMENLRDLNYKIVRVIRALKITKLSPDLLSSIQKEIEHCEKESEVRQNAMNEIIVKCLSLINTLHLSEDQFVNLQKQYHVANKSSLNEDGFIDTDTLKFIQSDPKQFGLVDHHIEFLRGICNILTKVKETKQKKWDYYLDSCTTLWDKLGEDREYVENFLNVNSSLTDMSLMNFKMELNKLFLKRSEFIESFILDARQEIEQLWAKLFYSDSQKQEFKYFNYDVNDNSLDKELVHSEHEFELTRLKEEVKQKQAILDLFAEVNELLEDEKFLQESSKDSSRLLSKNSCKILLNEEKIRKRINKNMPTVIGNLKTDIVKFNNEQLNAGKRPLMINGEDFFEKVLVIESQHTQQKSGRNRLGRAPQTRSQSLRSSPIKKAPVTTKGFSASRSRAGPSPKRPLAVPKRFPVRTEPVRNNFRSEPASLKGSRFGSPDKESHRNRMAKAVNSQLKPLHSPLVAQKEKDYEMLNDNTTHSNISRLSPLKINNNPNIYTPYKTKFSPVRDYELVTEDKENAALDKYALSPIRVVSHSKPVKDGKPDRMSIVSTDSSTIIGDEYQVWREERIRQLNSIRH